MGLRPKLARQMMAGMHRFRAISVSRAKSTKRIDELQADKANFVSCRVSCFFCYCALIKITKGLREIKPTFTATIAACSGL